MIARLTRASSAPAARRGGLRRGRHRAARDGVVRRCRTSWSAAPRSRRPPICWRSSKAARPRRSARPARSAAQVPTGSPFLEGQIAHRRGRGAAAARRRRGHQSRRQRALLAGRRAGRAVKDGYRQRAGELRARLHRACRNCSTISKPACRSCSSSRSWRRRRRPDSVEGGRMRFCSRSPAGGEARNEARSRHASASPPRSCVGAQARAANPPGALDLPPSNVIPAPVDVTPTAPRAERPADPSGNPLWAIPLSALTATRERPLFLPSRRAPAPAVAGTPVVVAPPPAAIRRAGAAAAHADRRDRERHGRLRGVPRSGNQHRDPAQDRPGSSRAGCCVP